jgi:autotransporter strand-loop-strand O-heptosyltransferase
MKILIIVSHLSTGGMPQVALKRVEALINKHDVYLIEYREIAWAYVVQRNKIKQLLDKKFISLGWIDKEDIRDHFEEIVTNINPDLIHMEEIPEKFIFGMRPEHANWLYRKDRPYKITETTHTMTFDVRQKKYFPDKFLFVSPYSEKEYSIFNIPSALIEYPIEKLEKNKSQSIKQLKFDPDYFHVLNVGLFTRDKNQGYLFDIANKLKDYKIHFHFIGNQAENFSDYWKPLMENKLDNCFVYGERSDVDIFYQASDVLVHSSILELNPLAVKEATSYDLPVFLFNLDSYLNMYDSYKNVKYMTKDVDKDAQMILDNFNIKKRSDNSSFQKSLLDEYDKIIDIKTEAIDVKKDEKDDVTYIDYSINFTDGARVEILGNKEMNFDVEIFDKNTNELVYQKTLSTQNWCATNTKYYREYKINIKYGDKTIISHEFNLKDKVVFIQFDSKSIGDTLAWIPYVDEFRKKHDCKVYCTTFLNKWFITQYPEITFIEPGTAIPSNIYAKYNIGWYQPFDSNKMPNDHKKMPLQKTASDVLGLEFKEIAPKIDAAEGVRPIKEKYVCIAQYSTAGTKHWNYPCKDSQKGWQILVDWLKTQGYEVMAISQQKTKLKGVIDKTGDFPIEHRINEIKYCEFFIGIGSGLSWLAWALGKKVVMISGFSSPICEFKSNNIHIHNFNVCNSCFNRYDFDRGDWWWCPEHKNTDRHFECSINITPQMITERIVNSKLVENPQPFDFEKYNIPLIKLNSDDLHISYEKEENKLIFGYKGDTTHELCIDIKNFNNNDTFHVVSDIELSKDYVIWTVPKKILHEETNKLLITFYERNKILDVEFEI